MSITQVGGVPATSASVVEDRSTSFKGAPAGSESVPGGTLLIVAYIIVWVGVLLLILRVFSRQTAVIKRVESLEAELKKKP